MTETQRIRGACPHDCPDTCGVVSEVVNGQVVDFYADPGEMVTVLHFSLRTGNVSPGELVETLDAVAEALAA